MRRRKKNAATNRYYGNDKYDESEFEIHFHRQTSGVKKLIHTNPRMEEWVPWKFPEEHLDITHFCPSNSDSPTSNSSVDANDRSEGHSSNATASKKTKTQMDAVSFPSSSAQHRQQHIAQPNNVQQATSAPITLLDGTQLHNQPLSNNIAGTGIPGIQYLSALIGSTSTMNNGSNRSALVDFISFNMKHSIVHKFSSQLPSRKYRRTGLEGYDSSDVIISTTCDLESFIQLVSTLDAKDECRKAHAMRFNPNRESFYDPSRATESLSVDFNNLKNLLTHLQLRDSADHQRIGVKRVSGKSGHLLRMLGTSCVLSLGSSDSDSAPTEVDCVLPFMSTTPSNNDILKELLQAAYNNSKQQQPHLQRQDHNHSGSDIMFYRFRENYDEGQGRYLSPWKAVLVPNNCFKASSTTGLEQSSTDDSTFSIEWSRSSQITSSTWTSDALFTGQYVLGEIMAFFPTVTFFGISTVREIDSLISDYL